MPKEWNNSRKVIFSRDEVNAFRAQWPCCKLRDRSYWFEFDKEGNLVDCDVPEQDDGTDAGALCEEARDFLTERGRFMVGRCG